jgi:hypothetical protein
MKSPFTNLGSNIDPDAHRDQSVDRERETDDGFGAERRRLMFAEIADNNRRNLRLCQKSNLEEAARRDTERALAMCKPILDMIDQILMPVKKEKQK